MNSMLKSVAFSILFLLLYRGCLSTPPTSSDGSGSTKYDGTYNWSISVHGVKAACFDCVFIKNGVISNLDGSFEGAISVDDAGNILFHGQCPVGKGGNAPCRSNYWGMAGGMTYHAWMGGTWVCCDGSTSSAKQGDAWTLFQHH